jgi:hypothetical protein
VSAMVRKLHFSNARDRTGRNQWLCCAAEEDFREGFLTSRASQVLKPLPPASERWPLRDISLMFLERCRPRHPDL